MKICYICDEIYHGGIGTFIYTLARQLVDLGCEVHVIGYDRGIDQDAFARKEDVQVSRLALPFHGRNSLRTGKYDLFQPILERVHLSARVKTYCQKAGIDLVESYDWSGPLWSHPGKPLLVRMHGGHTANAFSENKPSSKFMAILEQKNLRMADYLVGVSNHISKVTLRATKMINYPYTVIYNGVDCSLFSPARVDIHADEVLYVGSVNRRKGIYEFFKAAMLILAARPETYFTFVGNLSEMERLQVERALNDLAPIWQEKFHFIGRVSHQLLPAYYRQAAVVVFPSLAEAFGLTCAEAMACGKAVVATTLASGPELVEHECSGLLADPTIAEAFASAVLRLLDDASLAGQLGRTARERALALFNLQDLAERNLAFYREVLS